nr:polysaccharide pyruvyl transferase family protein [Microlunatus endophyticus]
MGAGTEALLRRLEPDVQVMHQGYGPGDAPTRIGAPKPQVRRLIRDSDGLVDWVRTFDIVIDTRAGDSFADIYGLGRLLTMNLMQEIVRKAKVPVTFGPQTIGPFTTRRGRLLARRALHNAVSVMARDPESADAARRLGRPVDVLGTDVVFAIDRAEPDTERDVLLNVSGLLWRPNSHVDHAHYQRLIMSLSERLVSAGRQLTLLSHVIDSPDPDNDVPANAELASMLEERGHGRPEILIPGSLDEARRHIASARIVIGSRMHACLNALSLGVPAVPLSYSRKFEPLLGQLNWRQGVDLRSRDASMADRIISAVDDPTLAASSAQVRDRAHGLLEPVYDQLERVVA